MKGIYQIKNNKTGDRYIGSSVNIRRRWNAHKSELRMGYHHSPYLQNAWNKYGKGNFAFRMILECEAFELQRHEQWLLDNWNPEYNTEQVVGKPQIGRCTTEETREKIRQAHLGKVVSLETRTLMSKNHTDCSGENNPMYGQKHTYKARYDMAKNRLKKLTKADVVTIRELYETKEYTHKVLARTWCVSEASIGKITRNETWRFI